LTRIGREAELVSLYHFYDSDRTYGGTGAVAFETASQKSEISKKNTG